MSERLFDNHPTPPATLLRQEARLRQSLGNCREEIWLDRQIKHYVPRGFELLLGDDERLLKLVIGLRIVECAFTVRNSTTEPAPKFWIDRLSSKLCQSFSELLSKHVIRKRPACDADNIEVGREKVVRR